MDKSNTRNDVNALWAGIRSKVGWFIFVPVIGLIFGWIQSLQTSQANSMREFQAQQAEMVSKLSATVLSVTNTINEIDRRASTNQVRISHNESTITRLETKCGG
ncbi:MAG: hypothetical protein ABIL58_10430 [Pseudomonadota bacterium]